MQRCTCGKRFSAPASIRLCCDCERQQREARAAAFVANPSAYIAEFYDIFDQQRLRVTSPDGSCEVYEPGEPAFEAAAATATTDWLDQWL